MALNLTDLGAELDAIRRQRAPSASSLDSASTGTYGTSPASPPLLAAALPALPDPADTEKERPFALCLLCLARPPSAVLLPCCHMNLCYLCAPALIARNAPACPAARADDAPPRTDRVPFNVALARAMRSSPNKRRLGMAGHIPPGLGASGGEFAGKDVLTSSNLRTQRTAEGRVELSTSEGGKACGTQCLVCRSGVEGWLRVYTG